MILYALLASARSPVLRSMSRRWRRQDEADDDRLADADADDDAPDGPDRQRGRSGAAVTTADWVALVMVFACRLYAWSGLADFGAGFWDLVAGGRERGPPAAGAHRHRDHAGVGVQPRLAGLPARHQLDRLRRAFASMMTTLFIPLALAALGIVLRGANFALRKDAAARRRPARRRLAVRRRRGADPVLPRRGAGRPGQRPGAAGQRRR